jgi:uncharacterized membrane protein
MQNQGSTGTHRINDPKVIGIISYLTLVGWVIAFVLNNPKSELASFHLRQSLGLFVTALAIRIVMYVPFLGWLVGIVAAIATFVLWVIGFISAVEGQKKRVPFLGDYFQEWFAGL